MIRYDLKNSILHATPYGPVALTCFFNYHRATHDHKFAPHTRDKGQLRAICNGCGPAGYGALVPDRIRGVKITECGNIHNWGYQFGTTREDRQIQDETFGDNMDRIIRAKLAYDLARADLGNRFLRRIRKWNARRRYRLRLIISEKVFEKAVRVWGKSSFWDKAKCDFFWRHL